MRFGIIGTNFVSDSFMMGAELEKDCEVVAVCCRTESNLLKFQEKYSIPYAYTDYKLLAENKLIDAVYVAVPNSTHYEVAKYFLERKIPVFCEKPLASNINEVESLIDIAMKNHVYFQEGLVPLYLPNYKIVKDHLHLVGKIRQVNVNFSKYSSRYDAYLRGENPTTFRADLSNGATMDLGIYCIGFVVGLFGKPNRIHSAAALIDTGVDVSGSSIFEYDDFTVSLNYSKVCDANPVCEICGEEGTIHVDHPSKVTSVMFTSRKNHEKVSIGKEKVHSFYYEINEMIRLIHQGSTESESVPLSLSSTIHEVMSEVRKQAGIVYPADLVNE